VSFTGPSCPSTDAYAALKKGSGNQEVATTMALVRVFKDLLRTDKDGIGKRIVPIIPDEARTFGMDSWFPTAKIYDRLGQTYEPVDQELLLSYKQAKDGQIIHEGITEAGSMGTFHAAGTSYATHGEPMIPLYIFYSMFGFQRTADSIWSAADQRARGFLIGATAGGTTLNGEGLQHQDRHSLLMAQTNPAVEAYDPSFAYEIAVLVEHGLERMYGDDEVVEGGRGRHLLPHRLQRAGRPAGDARPRRRPAGHRRAVPLQGGPGRRAHRPHPVLRHDHQRGAAGPGAARRGLGRLRRRVVGAGLEPAAARRARSSRGTGPTRTPSRASRW
jgi:hypothetical protein